MASTLHQVRLNFAWRIAAATPTEQAAGLPARFRLAETTRNVGAQPGSARLFTVSRISGVDDQGKAGPTARTADHIYRVDVYYPDTLTGDMLERVIDRDRDDIAKALIGDATTDTRLGYDADNPTTYIGLIGRWRQKDEKISGAVTISRLTYRCTVREV